MVQLGKNVFSELTVQGNVTAPPIIFCNLIVTADADDDDADNDDVDDDDADGSVGKSTQRRLVK